MLAPGLDSIRTVCVTPAPVFWTLTRVGGPGSGSARTVGWGSGGRCERRTRRTSEVAPAAANTTAPRPARPGRSAPCHVRARSGRRRLGWRWSRRRRSPWWWRCDTRH